MPGMAGPGCHALPPPASRTWLAVVWLVACWGAASCTNIAYQDCVALASWPQAADVLGLTSCTKPMTDCTGCHGKVTTDHGGRVIKVKLSRSNLSGPLPLQWSQLGSLQSLSLFSNNLSGPLPAEWSHLSSLQGLDLWDNRLSGTLPSQWSQLSSLEAMSLSTNRLSGPPPSQWSQMSSLTFLSLFDNRLSGPLPSQWSQLSILQSLVLMNNNLSGLLPSQWSQLSNLGNLQLSNNNLSGPLPPQWSQLSSLDNLELYANSLSGPLPVQWSQLISSRYLVLSKNNLSSPLPPQWSQLRSLLGLSLSTNHLNGPLPSQWSQLSSLEDMSLFNNRLSGPLPSQWSQLSILKSLSLFNNRLSGPLPSQWSQLSILKSLFVSNNVLSNTLPHQWSTLSKLEWIDLHNNSLSGPIPSTWNMPALAVVQLDNNHFSGSIPTMWLAKSTSLNWFSASNNNFTGSMSPLALHGKPNFAVLDVQSNSFSGQVRDMHKSNLQVLRVGHNNFTSTLPRLPATLLLLDASHNSFTGGVPSLPPNLVYLNLDSNMLTTMGPLNASNLLIASLASNRLSQQLPADWNRALQLLNISNNQLSNTLPQSWANHTWVVLDISGNDFSGPLPQLLPARVLVAGHNKFSGTLPEHWPQNNSMARVVDLKGNHFEGRLPTSWFDRSHAQLQPHLQYLDISDNSFRGGVPLQWITMTGTKLVLGKDVWMQHKTLANLLLGRGGEWFKAVCTNPKLYRSILDVSRVREVDAQIASLVADMRKRLLNVTQGVVENNFPAFQYDISIVMAMMYLPWFDLVEPSPYLDQLKSYNIPVDIRANDLCKDPNALPIVSCLWSVLLACILALVCVYVWLRPHALHRSDATNLSMVGRWLLARHGGVHGLFGKMFQVVVHLVSVGLYWADIITDLLVIMIVRGNWPVYALAAIFLSNYMYSASVLTSQMSHTKDHNALHWILYFPAMLLSLPLLDTLAFLHAATVPVHHMARAIMIGVDVDMDKYHAGRSFVETFLESIPSCIVQSIIYVMGNNPSRPLYVDLRLFMFSIVFSSARTLTTCVSLMWEGMFHPDGMWRHTREILLGTGVFAAPHQDFHSKQTLQPVTEMSQPVCKDVEMASAAESDGVQAPSFRDL